MLKTVTITGADDSVKPADLLELSEKFPFVEWGILVSASQQGTPRFPSMKWVEVLKETTPLNLSLHICGRFVRDFFQFGSTGFLAHVGYSWDRFKRVQLNTHGDAHIFGTDSLRLMAAFIKANQNKQFIFQMDNVNDGIVDFLRHAEFTLNNIAGLFDLSHGAGILPSAWPKLRADLNCGYAGGLSPENLEQQIQKIEQVVGAKEIWIDMETHVRSNHDAQFDLAKVERCLEIASMYILKDAD